MIIHLYTRCWNDAHMLPFLFRHYDPIVDRYIVFDDGSTDGSLELLASHPKVDARPMPPPSDPLSRVASGTSLLENCWHESRGMADWVIVTDIDEHLCHRDLPAYLNRCQAQEITIIPALGYEMISELFPPRDALLCRELTVGARSRYFNKLNLFSPDRVQVTNFEPGRHFASPKGDILAPPRDELLLLHYKCLDFERTYERHRQCQSRQRAKDLAMGWGYHYRLSRSQQRRAWDELAGKAVNIAARNFDPDRHHPRPRWWDKYRAEITVKFDFRETGF